VVEHFNEERNSISARERGMHVAMEGGGRAFFAKERKGKALGSSINRDEQLESHGRTQQEPSVQGRGGKGLCRNLPRCGEARQVGRGEAQSDPFLGGGGGGGGGPMHHGGEKREKQENRKAF